MDTCGTLQCLIQRHTERSPHPTELLISMKCSLFRELFSRNTFHNVSSLGCGFCLPIASTFRKHLPDSSCASGFPHPSRLYGKTRWCEQSRFHVFPTYNLKASTCRIVKWRVEVFLFGRSS